MPTVSSLADAGGPCWGGKKTCPKFGRSGTPCYNRDTASLARLQAQPEWDETGRTANETEALLEFSDEEEFA
ncbi:MAG: hypothetical protein IH991_09555 [Planctomycetes bacterium]|nr:hypothetical protein [Planctomycetota bacterium]